MSRSRIHRVVSVGISGWVLSMAVVAAEQGPVDTVDTGLVESRMTVLADMFRMPDDTRLNATSRTALSTAAEDLLRRARPMLAMWVAEERARAGAAGNRIALALDNRIANAIAIWRLASPGPQAEAALLPTTHMSAVCALADERTLAGVVARLEAVPADQRAAAVEGERRKLLAFGRDDVAIPERPSLSLEAVETAAIAKLKLDEIVAGEPMPPVLADATLDRPLKAMDRYTSCALHQWGLGVALARPDADPRQAWLAWRYAMTPTASQLFEREAAEPAWPGASPDYPVQAARRGVQGVVTVRITPGPTSPTGQVVARELEVDGIRGQRPLAFETMLDDASIASALKTPPPPANAKPDAGGIRTVSIEWHLQ